MEDMATRVVMGQVELAHAMGVEGSGPDRWATGRCHLACYAPASGSRTRSAAPP